MHPTIKQRTAILSGLRLRSQIATADFYKKARIEAPAQGYRFQVQPAGRNKFEVVDSKTGQLKAEVVGHLPACAVAQGLENAPPAAMTPKRFGWLLFDWVLVAGGVLALAAYYGASQ